MSCSCIPPPASIQPRKIYNLLVPDVFSSLSPQKLSDPISASTQRKVGKLQEYVQKNPSKAAKACGGSRGEGKPACKQGSRWPSARPPSPQVSRRLTRRIKKALYEQVLGDVKVAVHAYMHLLDESTAQDSSYTFTYFNKELIHQPDAVVRTAGRCMRGMRHARAPMAWAPLRAAPRCMRTAAAPQHRSTSSGSP